MKSALRGWARTDVPHSHILSAQHVAIHCLRGKTALRAPCPGARLPAPRTTAVSGPRSSSWHNPKIEAPKGFIRGGRARARVHFRVVSPGGDPLVDNVWRKGGQTEANCFTTIVLHC